MQALEQETHSSTPRELNAAGWNSHGAAFEAVHINQATLGTRQGYKANFLGAGKLAVPLPKIPGSLKSKIATLKGNPNLSELKYFNYSVVMNKERKLAFFSAVNIDGGQQQDVGKREGDSWLRDPRIDAKSQVGDEFYGKQSTLEADRTTNPFDRGHWCAGWTPPGARRWPSQGTRRRFVPFHKLFAPVLVL
jgi:endonuclease G